MAATIFLRLNTRRIIQHRKSKNDGKINLVNLKHNDTKPKILLPPRNGV